MQRINNNIIIQRPNNNTVVPSSQKTNNGINFGDILNQKLVQNEDIKISKHAEERLKQRDISLTKDQMDQIKQAVLKADIKGVKESLVLMDDVALVVSVKNRTIITAVSSNELKDNVFTNIDGAVII